MTQLSHGLQRFINKAGGPVISLKSVAHSGFPGGSLWHSTARLHPKLVLNHPKLLLCRFCGFGWSRDRGESRRKAVVEALERWAYNAYALNAPEKAGVDINDSANGFAAMPSDMGEGLAAVNAYCEALERWVMNSIWYGGDVFFERCAVKGRIPPGVLEQVSVDRSFYSLKIVPERIVANMPAVLNFCLCLLKTADGGVISGSACAAAPGEALLRAVQELTA